MAIPIPLPSGCSGLNASPKRRSIIKNLFRTQGEYSVAALRPGVSAKVEGVGACRGMGIFRNAVTGDEEVIGVYGQKLLRVTITTNRQKKEVRSNDVNVEELGAIAGFGACQIVGDFAKLCIIEVGSNGYVYDDTDGLEQITDPDFLPSDSVDIDAGRFVFVPSDGSPFFWSALGNPGDIDKQDFADAERFTDPNKYVKFYNDTIVIGGARSHQRFDYNATQDTYRTFEGEGSTIGYVGGLTDYGESFAFIGLGNDGGFNIYLYSPAGPQPISNDFIAEFLNTTYSLIELERTTANTIEWKGVTLLFFNLPNHTLCFYGSGWSFVQSGISGADLQPWQIKHIQQGYGYFFTGDDGYGAIGILEDIGTEYGEEIESGYQLPMPAPKNSNTRVRFVYADATLGTSPRNREPRLSLALSEDGRIFSAPDYQTLGKTGHYNHQIRYSIMARYNAGVVLLLLGYGDVAINHDGLEYE